MAVVKRDFHFYFFIYSLISNISWKVVKSFSFLLIYKNPIKEGSKTAVVDECGHTWLSANLIAEFLNRQILQY